VKPIQTPAHARIAALDGLRGMAAVIVVAFHYLSILHFEVLPRSADAGSLSISDTPLAILWNGRFAVSVFFVLSGFVMAASAERRRDQLVANIFIRYLRLTIPVTASVVLAWILLNLAPSNASEMLASAPNPSPWLAYTYQDAIPSLLFALADGLLGNFLRGYSLFNNVLWTMRIELIGSVLLFVAYWMLRGQRLLWTLVLASIFIPLFLPHSYYLGFVIGALLYEAWNAGLIARMPPWTGLLSLAVGIALGSPGSGFDTRMSFPVEIAMLRPGNPEGLLPALAAGLLLYATMRFGPITRLMSTATLRWLGRMSFGLYLVHVPVLYTIVAGMHLSGVPEPQIAGSYIALVLGIAYVFTLLIDEVTLRVLRKKRDSIRRMVSVLK